MPRPFVMSAGLLLLVSLKPLLALVTLLPVRGTRSGPTVTMLLVIVLGAAVVVSMACSALFVLVMQAAAIGAGWRAGRLKPTGLAWGLVGAVGLVAGPLVLRDTIAHPQLHLSAAGFPLWAVV